MIFDIKEYKLKDGRTLTLRNPEVWDARVVLSVFRQVSDETEFLLNYPEEIRERYTLESEAAFLRKIKDNPNSLMILAFVDGEYAGNCNIDFNTKIKTGHRRQIGIAIQRKFWNLGIGSILFENLIQTAEDRGGILQLELDVLEGNERAMALYRKFGFETVASLPDAIKLKDGRLLKTYTMIKKLQNAKI